MPVWVLVIIIVMLVTFVLSMLVITDKGNNSGNLMGMNIVVGAAVFAVGAGVSILIAIIKVLL